MPTAEVFHPLLSPARYKGAHGGRGSGKSHFFGELSIEDALRYPGDYGEGMRMACIREIQKSLKDSAKRLIEDKLEKFGLGEAEGFKIYKDRIATPKDGIIIFNGMQDHTADSVKSLEGFHRAWTEEAHSLSRRSLLLLRPTIRAENSELWFSWNPDRPTDAVDQMLRGNGIPTGSTVVQANWKDNPWFPSVLEQERLDDLKNYPERYGHIWEGEYATVFEGAYYARHLTEAQQQGRITKVALDPLNKVYAFWDIGSTSSTSDACTIWICQFKGKAVHVLDYYEVVGQDFASHVYWLRSNGYERAVCILPHDGVKHDVVHKVTPEGTLRELGFTVEVVRNQGRGAAMQRVDAVRRLFPSIWFNEDTTEAGREALGWYHEKKDEKRNIGLGPHHDWASHGADSFGLMAIWFTVEQERTQSWSTPIRRNLKV